MILYLSSATSRAVFEEKFLKGEIVGVNPAQKFNYNLIRGLSLFTPVTAISALPVRSDVKSERICVGEDGVQYICIAAVRGKTRKIFNIINYKRELKRIVKRERPEWIVCDAVSLSSSWAARYAARKYKIPCAAVVTDIPGLISGKQGIFETLSRKFLERYDAYILLTEAMNDVVNPRRKPYLIMEGSCFPEPKEARETPKEKICLYSGALWRNAGLETMMRGFVAAGIADAQLHLYGDGAFRSGVEAFCSSHENVKYMGCVSSEEIVKRQREVTLLVNPRRTDLPFTKYSFPSKTLEYMLSGTPVLMTRLPGVPEEYEPYVYFVEEESVDGFAAAFREILGKNEAELCEKGEKARKFVAEKKSYAVQAERIDRFLCGLKGKN